MRLIPRSPFRHIALPRADRVRGRWPIARHMELYDVRICQVCGHLVSGGTGQRAAEHYHRELRAELDGPEEWQDPGGFVLPDQMPPGMTGARPAQDDDDEDGKQ